MLISMLHPMGTMVIAEGVETSEEALTLMDADIDFLQGYHFGKPTKALRSAVEVAEKSIQMLWPQLHDFSARMGAQEQAQIATVRTMLFSAARELKATASLESAARRFFTVPHTTSCFLLRSDGVQVGASMTHPGTHGSQRPRIRPLFLEAETNWSRRPYFKNAIKKPGYPSMYGPHGSLRDGGIVYTTAVTVDTDHGVFVLCGNFRLAQQELHTAGTCSVTPTVTEIASRYDSISPLPNDRRRVGVIPRGHAERDRTADP